jgi:hypothetical protein
MSNAGMMILWNDVKTSREKQAGELFNSTVAFYEQKVKEGVVESFEPVVLSRHGGMVNGFFLLRGEQSKLDTLRRSNDFKDFEVKAVLCLNGFGVVDAYLGKGLADIMKRWATNIPR